MSNNQSVSAKLPSRSRSWVIFGMLLMAAVLSLFAACLIGSVSLPFSEVVAALIELASGKASSLNAMLLELRVSRALAAFATGASLSLAGVMMQTLLRNPLADPYVLGVSSGASVGALASMLLLGAAWAISVGAFVGALLISLLLYLLARRDFRSGIQPEGRASLLLLTGVILASGCSALVMLMLSIAPDNSLRGMVFWLLGDLSSAQSSWLSWIVLGGLLLLVLPFARAVNILAMYDDMATTLGVPVSSMRKGLFAGAALLTASAVSCAGSIGFVGLIVPHGCRFAFGSDHRVLLPAATLVGGIFLVLADTLARSVMAPQQLPVGVVTALIGVPIFLFQLHRYFRK